MSEMNVTIEGYGEVFAKMNGLADRLENPSAASAAITDLFQGRVRERFATDGEGTWRPLRERDVEYKRRRGLDTRILRATGALERALTTATATVTPVGVTFWPRGVERYAYIVTRKRQIWSQDESRLLGDVAATLNEFLTGGL